MYPRILFLVFLVCSVNALSAPFITKCKANDSKCMKESAQSSVPIFAAGIPELGVERLDPLNVKHLDASAAGLSLHMRELTITGLKDCVIRKVQRDSTISTFLVKIQCGVVDVKAKYETKGRLLLLPIEGNGDAHIIIKNFVIQVEGNLIPYIGSDGQKYFAAKNVKHKYDLKDKSSIDLTNLFNGNEILGRAVHELIAANSNEIVTDIGTPIIKVLINRIIKNIIQLFEHVPLSELTLDN